MTVIGGPFGGFTISCAGLDCRQTTADQAPAPHWRTDEDRAVLAAKALGWIHTRDARGEVAWYCPMHQAWDPTARRWIPEPAGRTDPTGLGRRAPDALCRSCGEALIPRSTARTGWIHRDGGRVACPTGAGYALADRRRRA